MVWVRESTAPCVASGDGEIGTRGGSQSGSQPPTRTPHHMKRDGVFSLAAEDRGFEPLRAFTQPAFQASALGHYANPPRTRLPVSTSAARIGLPQLSGSAVRLWLLAHDLGAYLHPVAPDLHQADPPEHVLERHRPAECRGRVRRAVPGVRQSRIRPIAMTRTRLAKKPPWLMMPIAAPMRCSG